MNDAKMAPPDPEAFVHLFWEIVGFKMPAYLVATVRLAASPLAARTDASADAVGRSRSLRLGHLLRHYLRDADNGARSPQSRGHRARSPVACASHRSLLFYQGRVSDLTSMDRPVFSCAVELAVRRSDLVVHGRLADGPTGLQSSELQVRYALARDVTPNLVLPPSYAGVVFASTISGAISQVRSNLVIDQPHAHDMASVVLLCPHGVQVVCIQPPSFVVLGHPLRPHALDFDHVGTLDHSQLHPG